MPKFDKSTWSEGQTAVISRPGRQGVETFEATIEKIGRAWLTVKSESWSSDRYDFSGCQEGDIGHRAQLWPSRVVYEAEQGRKAAWRRFRKLSDSFDPPEHLSTEQIESLVTVLDDVA
ncbi:hypothetical protein MARCHEWKA_02600 [Brevundimonas phage vB_BpoS-Marchewka]|uniref:Uncharacterized protein n=1 Tax=Brevundimonas phage vB_BpoS-Marchewka TaxID=2948604 RepID=A0A9E7N579_9CAUD|nr:hypothetical protein MARCHEWKA_02600 [Brevundimonas phage vB_BpoS-Marchewka]